MTLLHGVSLMKIGYVDLQRLRAGVIGEARNAYIGLGRKHENVHSVN
jgi:hypothetical protein